MLKKTLNFWEEMWEKHPEKCRSDLCWILHPLIKGRYLDIGCGDWTCYDFQESEHSIGLDVSLNALKGAKENVKGEKDYDLIRATACNLPFKDKSFDYVSMVETLTLTGEDYEKVLDEAIRVTENCLVFTATHKEVAGDIFRNPVESVEKVVFTEEEIINLLENRGFKVEDLKVYTEEECENLGRPIYSPYYVKIPHNRKAKIIVSARKID